MRAIFGKPYAPDSSYILVLRGLDPWSMDYFYSHARKYPTWGCLVFPEKDEVLTLSLEGLVLSSIHMVFVEEKYKIASDEDLIKWVKNKFPSFSEDDTESSCAMSKPGTDHFTIPSIKRIQSIGSCKELSSMEISRSLSVCPDGSFIDENVRMCKQGVLQKIFDTPEFWDIDVSKDDYTGNMRISVKINVEVSEKSKE